MSDDPTRDIAIEVFQMLATKANTDTAVILSAVSIVLATIAVEAGMEEEKIVYAFRR